MLVVGGRYHLRGIANAVLAQSAGAKQCVLHAHMGWSTVVAPLISQSLDLPAILTFHNELHRYGRGVRWGVKAGAAFRPKLLFNGVSDTVANQWSGFLRRSVETVYNPLLQPLVEWPRPYSSQGSLKLVAVARLTALKNLAFALRVVAALRQRVLACFFTIVGDGPERLSLEQHVDDLRLRDVVQFVGYQSEVTGYLDASDLFLLPSHAEGFCLAAVEAMARGCPVMTHSGLGGG